ncbi:MAG: class I SAM-dependent methyltransferase [Zoogloeaceae bacterium]|nr:class I SAM-dependent methyltransferase [Zoogloeaceae bacterium]
MMPSPIPELEFSRKYDQQHAESYFRKHRQGISRRLSNLREIQIARKALHLAGNPATVLDLPCGAGRFWPMLLEQPERALLAADNSQHMLDVALTRQPTEITRRVTTFQSSAFAIELPDAAVDCLFCMRLLHHIGDAQHRLAMLREFHRVTRDTLIVSLWVDGNYKAWKRKKLETTRFRSEGDHANQNRFVIAKTTIETEFRQAGFHIVGHFDFLPGYAMWRVYTLRKTGA